MSDGLEGELFTCAVCEKQFPSTDGAWPALTLFNEYAVQLSGKIDAGINDDGAFHCYEHCPDGPFREDQPEAEGETVLEYLWREKMGVGKSAA